MIVACAVFFFLAGAVVGGMICYDLGSRWGAWRYGWRK